MCEATQTWPLVWFLEKIREKWLRSGGLLNTHTSFLWGWAARVARGEKQSLALNEGIQHIHHWPSKTHVSQQVHFEGRMDPVPLAGSGKGAFSSGFQACWPSQPAATHLQGSQGLQSASSGGGWTALQEQLHCSCTPWAGVGSQKPWFTLSSVLC